MQRRLFSRIVRALDRGLSKGWWILLAVGVLLTLVVVLAVDWFSDDEEHPRLALHDVPDSGEAFSSALFQNVATPMRAGHDIDIVHNGAVFDAIASDIASAQASIHVLVYIWEDGAVSERIVAAIVPRARAGVQCRVLVDAFGSPDFLEEIAPKLEDAGCRVHEFRPTVEIARNHRKLVVVDGRIAFTGGFGMRDEWLGSGLAEDEWRDVAVRFQGPAVRDAQQAFAENWLESGGELLPVQAFPDAAPAGRARAAFVTSTGAPVITRADRLTQLMIAAASERLWIANAYFVPSKAICDQLAEKAALGVDVRVLTAGKKSDSKTSWGAQNYQYGELLEHGVRVWEYEPTMMHAKTMVVDDQLAVIGTINLDPLSLGELDEAALVVEDAATTEQLARSFEADCEHADEQRED
jgi:cardiolipin synthase